MTGAADASLDPKVEEAREVFRQLLKSIKNIQLYEHAEVRYLEFMTPAFAAITQYLEQHDSLALRVEPFSVKLGAEVVHEDEDRENLTYKFYRDGVRYLIFRRGLPERELLEFALLAMKRHSDTSLSQEDVVTRLWKQELQFIEYVVVEGFDFGALSEEEVEIEVDKIIGHLRKQLAANDDDVARFARLSLEDLQLELDDIEQIRGGIISGRTARPEEIARAQDELHAEQKDGVFSKMILILFQILERDAVEDDWEALSEAFTQVVDALLLEEDIRGVMTLVQRLRAAESKEMPEGRRAIVHRMGQLIGARLLEPQRLESLNRYMSLTSEFDVEAVKTYLSTCTTEQVDALLDMLASQERKEARNILVEVIAQHGAGRVKSIAERIDQGSSNQVRDMLAILSRMRPTNLVELVARTQRNDNAMVRAQGLGVLALMKDEKALRFIERAGRDPEPQVRLAAYRALAKKAPLRSAEFFRRLIEDEAFGARPERERVAIATALGETGADSALKFFRDAFEADRGGFFQRQRGSEMRMLAIAGLSAMGTVGAFKVLAREVQNRANGKEVMVAAQKAALALKAKLEGQPTESSGGGEA